MDIIKSLPACTLPLSIMLLMVTQAQANDVGGTISANSLMSDNTTKSAVEPIEERQDIYQAGLTADYTNWLIEADASYQFYAQKFAENSQVDEEYVDGSSMVVFGKEHDPFGLELNHSRRMLLQSPDAVGLVENMQEREIISAMPIVRTRIFGADTLFLQGQATSVSFPDDTNQDSKRNGATFGWAHPLSKTDVVQFSAQQVNVSFDQQPEADYKLANAMLTYVVQLRKLNYRIELGYNEVVPEVGEDQDAPTYNAELGYSSGYNHVSASLGRQITDSSFGDGNLNDPTQIPGGDGFAQNVGRIDRKKADVNWSTDFICGRCSFSIGASLVDDEYLESDKKSRNVYTRSAFIYSLSNAATVEFRADRSKYDFEGDQALEDYSIDYLSLKYSYRFLNGIDVQLFARKEERDSDIVERSYKENIYGGGLGYFF